MLFRCFCIFIILSIFPVYAQESPIVLPDLTTPPLSVIDEAESSVVEPEVLVIEGTEATIEEYRMNGRLYMAKIIPLIGRPYYLIDMDGDGFLETTRHSLDGNSFVPQWVLFSW